MTRTIRLCVRTLEILVVTLCQCQHALGRPFRGISKPISMDIFSDQMYDVTKMRLKIKLLVGVGCGHFFGVHDLPSELSWRCDSGTITT